MSGVLVEAEPRVLREEPREPVEKDCPYCHRLILIPGRNYGIDPEAVCHCRHVNPYERYKLEGERDAANRRASSLLTENQQLLSQLLCTRRELNSVRSKQRDSGDDSRAHDGHPD